MKPLIIAFIITHFAQLLQAEVEVISPGDLLHLTTPYNEGRIPSQRDAIYVVGPEGKVDFGKGLGVFQTKNESAQAILKKLIAKHFPKRASSVKLHLLGQTKELKKEGFMLVFGAVTKAEEGKLKAPLKLEDALEKVGGGTRFAAMNRIRLTRDGETTILNLRKDKPNPELKAGDLLFIPQKHVIGR